MAKNANVTEEVKIDETVTTEVTPVVTAEEAPTSETPAETSPVKEVSKKSSKKPAATTAENVDKCDANKAAKDTSPARERINADDPKKYVPLTTQFMM